MIIIPAPRGTCLLRAKLDTATFDKLNSMPGFYKWEGRDMIFRPTAANVEYLVNAFPDADWQGETAAHVKAVQDRNRLAESIRENKLILPGDADAGFPYRTSPYEHQRRPFLLSRDLYAFALLMEQRTGKTKVIIDTSAHLYLTGRIDTLVVVSVNGVHRNWIENEIPKHMSASVPYLGWFSRSNHTKQHQLAFERTIMARGLRIFAFHIEAFSSARDTIARFKAAIGKGERVLLVMDESTRIKNKSAERSKVMMRVGSIAKYRRILTGTPIVKDPTDIFGQFYFLDPDILGYDTLTTFKSHFCHVKKFARNSDGKFQLVTGDAPEHGSGPRFEKITGVKNAEELYRLIDGASFRVLRKDCMDLPPKVYKRRYIELGSEQRRLYSELAEEYITDHNGQTLSAALAMTRALRLQQILCNWWPMEDVEMVGGNKAGDIWRKVRPIEKTNPRLEALKQIISSTDDQIIIWSRFRPDLELIQNEFGADCVSYHGGIKEDARAANYRAFQDRRKRIFAANPASAGLGLELSMAGTEVYYCNGFNLEHRLQSEDRAEGPYKQGATQIIDLEVPGSVDTKTIRNLRAKKDISDLILRDPRSFFLDITPEE